MTPKKEITKSKAEEKKIAYTVTDKYFPNLHIYFSANAWWMDKGKLERLIAAFKIDAAIMEACVYAGITYEQYKYFVNYHPDFSLVKQACSELPCLTARKAVVDGLSNDKEFSLKYLERKKKDEFNVKISLQQGGQVKLEHGLSDELKEMLEMAGAKLDNLTSKE